jgi:hypothetical protein
VAFLCLACAFVFPAPLHAATPGQVNLVRDATSAFDSYTADATPAQQQWIQTHYSSMRGYAPFFNQALRWAPPTDFYRDLYAIYREGSGTPPHDNWILKDSSGRNLYIPADCNGIYCTQYAGDVGNPEFRHAGIAEAQERLAKGYRGIFVDDVNMTITVSNGAGTRVTPIDPRTGQPMTEENWRRYVAEFTEEIRAAMPTAEIVHNTPWFENQNDPYVRREIAAADTIELERGFSDSGLTGGTGTYAFKTLLAHIDWLHSLGKRVMIEPYIENDSQRELNLAGYYLINTASDSLVTSYESDPDNYWPGWETNLGAALGPRYEWRGLLRRDFEGGFVLVNLPGSPTTTVALNGEYTTAAGAKVRSVQLSGREGVVLTAPLAPTGEAGAETPGQRPAEPPVESPAEPEPPVEPESPSSAESASPIAESSGSSEAAPASPEASEPSTAAATTPAPAPETTVGTTTLTGAVAGARRVRVTIKIRHQTAVKGWRVARVLKVVTNSSGRFSKRVAGLKEGSYQVRARAAGHSIRLRTNTFTI